MVIQNQIEIFSGEPQFGLNDCRSRTSRRLTMRVEAFQVAPDVVQTLLKSLNTVCHRVSTVHNNMKFQPIDKHD